MSSKGEHPGNRPGNRPGDRNFHLLMGGLLLASFILDQRAGSLAHWDPPMVSMITLVLAMVWLGRFTVSGFATRADKMKVLEDRIARAERKIDGLERELVARQQPPLT